MSLKPVPDEPGTELIAPWDRSSLRSCLDKTDEKRSHKLETRVTASKHRAVATLIQHRIVPELETQSDVVQAGVAMILHYAKLHGKDSAEFRRALDVSEWEQTTLFWDQYNERVTKLLDRIENRLKVSMERGHDTTFLKVFAGLERNRKEIEEEELESRANKIWVLYLPHAKKLRKTK